MKGNFHKRKEKGRANLCILQWSQRSITCIDNRHGDENTKTVKSKKLHIQKKINIHSIEPLKKRKQINIDKYASQKGFIYELEGEENFT